MPDSALALGPLMAQFGWNAGDGDALACGVPALAGIIRQFCRNPLNEPKTFVWMKSRFGAGLRALV